MNKEDFMSVLQCSVFAFEGKSIQELCEKYEFPEKLAKAGYDLALYLKSINCESAK